MKFLSPVVLSLVMLTLNAGAAAQDKTRNYLALVVAQTEIATKRVSLKTCVRAS